MFKGRICFFFLPSACAAYSTLAIRVLKPYLKTTFFVFRSRLAQCRTWSAWRAAHRPTAADPGGPGAAWSGASTRGRATRSSARRETRYNTQTRYPLLFQSCAYLLVTWRVVSSPPCRQVEDTFGLCSGWPAPLCSCINWSSYRSPTW